MFGEKLRRAREGSGLSQQQACNTTPLNVKRLSALENNKSHAKDYELNALQKAYGFAWTWLFDNDTAPANVIAREAQKLDAHDRHVILSMIDALKRNHKKPPPKTGRQ